MKTNRILSVLFYALFGSLIAGAMGGWSPIFAVVGAIIGQALSYFQIAENVLAINLPTTIKEAREQRAKLEADLKSWSERVKTGSDKMTDDDWEKWDQMIDDSRALREHLERLEKAEEILKQQAEQINDNIETTKKEITKEEKEKVFSRFLKVGMRGLPQNEREIIEKLSTENAEIRAALGTTSGAVGGYLMPEGFSNNLEQAMLPYLAGLQYFSTIDTATGNDLPWPKLDDTSNEGEQIDENPSSDVDEQGLTFDQQTLKAYTFTSKMIKVSVQLLQDSYFNLDTLIQSIAGERLGRILNKKFTNGNGSSTIDGILHAATNANVSSVSASALTRDNIVDLMYSVNSDYRQRGIWMIADATEKVIRKLAFGTSDDRPLWQASMREGAPDTIEGKPYFVNNQMDGPSAGAISIAFGDMKKYIIRRVKGNTLVIFREKYMSKLQVAYMIYCRYDGQLLDAGQHPVKYIKHALT